MGETNQTFNDIPRENSAISFKDNHFELDLNVTHRAGAHARYADSDHIRLLSLGPIVLFYKNKITKSSGKEIEELDNALGTCLMNELISSSRDSDDL